MNLCDFVAHQLNTLFPHFSPIQQGRYWCYNSWRMMFEACPSSKHDVAIDSQHVSKISWHLVIFIRFPGLIFTVTTCGPLLWWWHRCDMTAPVPTSFWCGLSPPVRRWNLFLYLQPGLGCHFLWPVIWENLSLQTHWEFLPLDWDESALGASAQWIQLSPAPALPANSKQSPVWDRHKNHPQNQDKKTK